MSELARRARLSKQTMTTMVRLLEREGLVRRRPDPTDGRATLVELTAKARAFRPVAEHALAELDGLVRTFLSPADVRRLKAALKGVIAAVKSKTVTTVLPAPRSGSSPTSPMSRTCRAGRPSSPAS